MSEEKKELIIEQALGLSVMDDNAKEALEHLQGELTVRDLAVLRPVIEATEEVAKTLAVKYDKEKEEETVQLYKDGKRTYGAFNTLMTEKKKELKEPFTKTTKAIDVVFNKFKELYTASKEHLATEFKPYIDEQQRIKEEKAKKKTEALTKELEEQKAKIDEVQQKANRTVVFNGLKYDVISNAFEKEFALINELNMTSIENRINILEQLQVEGIIDSHSTETIGLVEFNQLETEDKETLRNLFLEKRKLLIEKYKVRLQELNAMKRSGQDLAVAKAVHTMPATPPLLPEPSATSDEFDIQPEGFLERKIAELENIQMECEYYVENHKTEHTSRVSNLNTMLIRALEFINSKI